MFSLLLKELIFILLAYGWLEGNVHASLINLETYFRLVTCVSEIKIRAQTYGTPLLPPGDCVLAIESTPRYILCIHHYI